MAMHGQCMPVEVFGGVESRVFDIQGARKCEGAAAHSHNIHPCNLCLISHSDINSPAGYDIKSTSSRVCPLVLLLETGLICAPCGRFSDAR